MKLMKGPMLVGFHIWKALLWEEVDEERYVCNTLQHTTTHCNLLQLTATHCNTLQHPVTHTNAWKALCKEADEERCSVIRV